MAELRDDAATEVHEAQGQDSMLLDRLRRLEGNTIGMTAVHFHLSRLRDHNRQPHHIRIAERSFDGLASAAEIQVFTLSNRDLVLLTRNAKTSDIERTVFKLRALFKGDPLLINEAQGEDRFSTWYDLHRDGEVLRDALRAIAGTEPRPDGETIRPTAQPNLVGRPMDPEALDEVCLAVARVGFLDLIRQQSAISIGAGGQGQVLFREHYVAIRELQKRLAPGIDLLSNRWLFQHLTELLDQRVLSTFARQDFAALQRPISLNLNLATLMSPQFKAFDRHVGEYTAKVVIEVQKIDVFADIGAYGYLREILQERGYRVLIDGLNPLSLQFFDPGLLKADLFKVAWGEEFLEQAPPERIAEMRALIQTMGRDKVIVAHVDSEEAIKFGLSLGVTRFQGHFIDRLLTAMAAKFRKPGDAA